MYGTIRSNQYISDKYEETNKTGVSIYNTYVRISQ